ncbi:MAG: UvrD-helicase domain-containing protein, partial [Gemmobacter sp.]
MMRDEASARQVQAADPAACTWVTANAGSGKTRVLTDRVARLLLGGTPPQRILCLTYTKAAAAEMQNRLFQRLGAWAMLDDAVLRPALEDLGADGPIGDDRLTAARRLFARAIETPGGLRIQTIHGFCAALLRRFPLEAGVSPRFEEMDDRTGELLRAAILEEMAEGPSSSVFADLARLYTGESFGKLAEDVSRERAAFDPPRDAAAIRAAFGVQANETPEGIVAGVLGPDGAGLLRAIGPVLAAGSKTDKQAAATLGAFPAQPVLDDLEALERMMLYGAGAERSAPFTAKIGAFPTKATRAALGPLLAPLEALMERVEQGRERRIALAAAERTAALHRFAAAFLPAYAAAKAARGWLDFDDLILRARALLTDPGVAQWVLWRLDGGIDHILVDEAQDTGPGQWDVIARLAQDMLAGAGARGTGRTIFVVGDRKQSIYSFQGADLAAFDAMQDRFAAQLAHGPGLQRVSLDYSFRSSPAILRAVDCTFDDAAGRGIGGAMRHVAFKATMPGRVDLWPPIPPAAKADKADWFDPRDLPRPQDPAVVLAETIADTIRGWLDTGTRIPGRDGTRPMRAGDILILVQRRSPLFAEIIRACKARDLPMAGSDRLRLGAEMAVKDIAALLAFLDMPEDDLSLAAALRSPLCGWSEGALFDLAHGRKGYLWQALRGRAAEWPDTFAMLSALRNAADFLRPYELIERVLTRHDGRRRLIARLGPEAEDG